MKKIDDLDEAMVERVVQRLAALADPNRIRILMKLRAEACTVGALAEHVGIAQPSVSKHVAILKQAGLLQVRRVGTQAICSVADPAIFELCSLVCDGVVRHLRKEQEVLQETLATAPAPVRDGYAKSRPGRK